MYKIPLHSLVGGGGVLPETLYNKIVNPPQNVKSLSVLSPGIGSWN